MVKYGGEGLSRGNGNRKMLAIEEGDGWQSSARLLLRQLSGLESRSLSKLKNGRQRQKRHG